LHTTDSPTGSVILIGDALRVVLHPSSTPKYHR
jgi:hypothetical protein